MQLILLSGLAGSGKSIALNVLEDSGYYCVDNLPVKLLPDIVHYLKETDCHHVAISVDVRSGVSVRELPHQITQLKSQGIDVRLLYLEASTETLVKRFSETRRRHPLSDDRLTLPECIKQENDILRAVGDHAHRIDTSELDSNALRSWIKDFIHLDRSRLTLLFQSFGFKSGIPLDADCVFDVRCLPNPNYDPKLRTLTGRDTSVITFLEQQEPVEHMLEDIRNFIEQWLPCFIHDNRNYLTIAIGCTGGQHRSVYMAEKLAEHFRRHQQVMVRHRGLS